MVAIVIISVVGVLGMLTCLAFFPTINVGKVRLQTFWMPPFISAIILLCSSLVPWSYFSDFLLSKSVINPLEILALFLSMSFISIVLDEAGFFSYLASRVVKKAGSSQLKVFLFLYLLTSLLTIFTSNDIIILTFTPFLIYFCKRTGVDPIPYLVGEFVAANTWSMLLLIGNPTNIFLGESFGINFIDYLFTMWPSALLSGVVSFAIMFLLFRNKLKIPFKTSIDIEISPIKDKPLMIGSLTCLLLCILLMALANILGWSLWLISVCAALVLLVFALIYILIKKKQAPLLGHSLTRLPYEVIPFVLAMFVLVLALKKSGITASLAALLDAYTPLWSYGLSSFLSCNLVNNIPTSVLYLEVIRDGNTLTQAVYATIIATNIGAVLTPVGALAGIMWMGLLKVHGISYSFIKFIKYGVLIAIPTLVVALVCLYF
jgi:arsenical pump membrane protein